LGLGAGVAEAFNDAISLGAPSGGRFGLVGGSAPTLRMYWSGVKGDVFVTPLGGLRLDGVNSTGRREGVEGRSLGGVFSSSFMFSRRVVELTHFSSVCLFMPTGDADPTRNICEK